MSPTKCTMSGFGQIASLLPDRIIENLAEKYRIHARSFSATSHVLALLYAQFSHSLGLNDLCDDLRNHAGVLKQIRCATPPSRNCLSHANRTRDASMAEALFWHTYRSIAQKYPEFLRTSRDYPGLPYRFRRTIYAVDSTTIQLTARCLDWAKHRRVKAALKTHVVLDMQSFLPDFVVVRSACASDPATAWGLCSGISAGEVVIFDKAYVDFRHLCDLETRGVFWVTRAKENMKFRVVGQHMSDETGETSASTQESMGQHRKSRRKYKRKDCEVLSDEHVQLTGANTARYYPKVFRYVVALVEIKGKKKQMSFITNNLSWSAGTICDLYRCRWGVEVFFKEIKQTLQLSDFIGCNENAVKWQVWTALLAYLLLRLIAWLKNWKHPFIRLCTLLRGVLWNYFFIDSVIKCCQEVIEKGKGRIRGSPKGAYQLSFAGRDWLN